MTQGRGLGQGELVPGRYCVDDRIRPKSHRERGTPVPDTDRTSEDPGVLDRTMTLGSACLLVYGRSQTRTFSVQGLV